MIDYFFFLTVVLEGVLVRVEVVLVFEGVRDRDLMLVALPDLFPEDWVLIPGLLEDLPLLNWFFWRTIR